MTPERDRPARRTMMSTNYDAPGPLGLLRGEGEPAMRVILWFAIVFIATILLTAFIHAL